MKKYFLVSCGELWWAVVLRGHAHWLESKGHHVVVCTKPSLNYIFSDFKTIDMPEEFNKVYGDCAPDSMGLYRGDQRVPLEELHLFFNKYKPEGYEFSPFIKLTYIPRHIIYPVCKWKPFNQKRKGFVAVFPRFRNSKQHSYRNLTKDFYIKLISNLLENNIPVICFGSRNGAYDITPKDISTNNKDNHIPYINMVGKTDDIHKLFQAVDEDCFCTVGGTSSLTKMMGMLQPPVPSFVIGHEVERFKEEENFFKARVGFYYIGGKNNYQDFNEEECLNEMICFVQSVYNE